MTISVLMSTYNGSQHITAQLDSLLSQTRRIDELVIVDDRSTDDTVAVAREYIQAHGLEDSWKVYVNEKNLGWRINFVQGIGKTTGDIMLFSDQDDIWLENKVEIVTGVLEKDPRVQVVASNETIWTGEPVTDLHITSDAYDMLELEASGRNYFICCSGCTMAIRRSYIDRVMPYHKPGWAHDDFFWKTATIDGAFALVRESTILHRIHGTNESRKKRTRASTVTGLQTELMIADQLLKYIQDSTDQGHPIPNAQAKLKHIRHKKEGNALRMKFFQTKKLSLLWKLALRYSDIYRRKRQIVKDLVLVRDDSPTA